MRPIWTGAIGFGLVNIPVKLYSAVRSSSLDLDMLDKKDLSKIRFQRVNENTGKVVEWADIVKGYLYNDHYVVLSDKDFEAAAAKKEKTIAIEDFVPEQEIETMLYETPYYLEPDKSGSRAYVLLREALLKTGRVGIAIFALRGKPTLSMLKAFPDVLVLNRLRFAEEIRSTEELTLPGKGDIRPAELQMAVNLIDQLTGSFKASKYKDTYARDLMEIVKAKAKGARLRRPALKVVHSKTGDLMEQLKASLSKAKKAS